MFYCYILKLSNNKFYAGFSANLKQRIREHSQGEVEATKFLRPLELVYFSGFKTKDKALKFEKYLKTQSGFAFRNKRLV